MDDVAHRKAELRARARAARASLSAEDRAAASHAVSRRALELPPFADARAVLAYVATSEEIDCEPLLVALRAAGARVAVPRVAGPRALDLHWVDDLGECELGSFGIREPTDEHENALLEEIDIVLVPGVAFDRAGHRIGFGGGFYDTLLAALPTNVPTIGLAFDQQIVEAIPAEEHDRHVDAVVTPSAVYPISPGSEGR